MDANEYKELVKDAVANIGAYCNSFEDGCEGCIFYWGEDYCELDRTPIWNWENIRFEDEEITNADTK